MPAPVETKAMIRERNDYFLSLLENPATEKRAADSASTFTRTKMREESYSDLIVPPITVTNDDLVRQYDTDLPAMIIDKEVDNPPARSVAFRTQPDNWYIESLRYRVLFDRVLSPKFVKDITELRTNVMDIRQVMADNAVKDMAAEKDTRWQAAFLNVLGTLDSVQPATGVVQYQTINGGMDRDGLVEGKKIMNRTPFLLEPKRALTNFVSWKEFEKWGRDEMGGDLSEKIVIDGMMEAKFLKLDWIVTIKRTLVPDSYVYHFADEKFIGKNFILEEPTLSIKRDSFMLEYFLYLEMGAAIGHAAGITGAYYP
jgi:hypothetical protein